MMPPTAEANTGRDFHMASVTVSPKPSWRLFCTTTLAWRWAAFTMSALVRNSSIGRATRRTASRTRPGSASQAAQAFAQHPGTFGIVGHAIDRRTHEGELGVAAPSHVLGEPL